MAINIFFFGDSISFGQGISIDQNWVTRIGLDLNKADRWGGKSNCHIKSFHQWEYDTNGFGKNAF